MGEGWRKWWERVGERGGTYYSNRIDIYQISNDVFFITNIHEKNRIHSPKIFCYILVQWF